MLVQSLVLVCNAITDLELKPSEVSKLLHGFGPRLVARLNEVACSCGHRA